MKHRRHLFALVIALTGGAELACAAGETAPSPESVKAITQRVADWQIATFHEHGKYRALPGNKVSEWRTRKNYPDLEWKKGTDRRDRWGWCDALFMAPPVWARLARITGEQKYLDFMDQEYHATYDLLWDPEESLFLRDTRYVPKREENGEKLFWARGNGWVFGGLALMIPDLPVDWEGRAFYVDLFAKMATRVKGIQRPDGTWSMGLLGGTEGYPIKETSGTSFYTFGLAWGVNNGLLDRATYEPSILKAWNALTECVTDEGLLGHVQPVGAAPGDSFPDYTETYGIGAFLAAGTEVYKLVGGQVPVVQSKPWQPVERGSEVLATSAIKRAIVCSVQRCDNGGGCRW